MEKPEDHQGPTAAPAETSLKQQEYLVQTNKNGTEGKSASVDISELADMPTDRSLARDAADRETKERVSKLECLTCGMLRRRRVRRRKTPRLEFAEDPPQQEEAAIGAPTAGNTDGELSSQDDEGAGVAQSSNIQVSATEGKILTVNQEISDGANPRYR